MSYFKLAHGIIRSKLFHTPFSANFKITERCNLRCPTCSIWRRASRERELTTEEIALAMQNLKLVGISRLVITGGEPTVRKDLVDIIGLASEQGFSTTLLTNGLLVDESLLRALVAAGLDHIGISLDFFTPEKQDRFYSSPGAWLKINETLKSALRCNKRGVVYTMATLMPENVGEVLPLQRTVEALGAHFVINPVMGSAQTEPGRLFSGSTALPHYSSEKLEEVERVYKQLIKLKRRGHHILGSEKYLKDTITWLKTNDIGWSCHAGVYYFNIFSDGGVAPCNEYASLLSICDPDFVSRFHSEEFQKKAEKIREQCSGCTYGCWRELSTFLTDGEAFLKQTVSYIRQILF